jgi:hypothetical protein
LLIIRVKRVKVRCVVELYGGRDVYRWHLGVKSVSCPKSSCKLLWLCISVDCLSLSELNWRLISISRDYLLRLWCYVGYWLIDDLCISYKRVIRSRIRLSSSIFIVIRRLISNRYSTNGIRKYLRIEQTLLLITFLLYKSINFLTLVVIHSPSDVMISSTRIRICLWIVILIMILVIILIVLDIINIINSITEIVPIRSVPNISL